MASRASVSRCFVARRAARFSAWAVRAAALASAPNPASTILPYGSSGYRSLQVPYGGQPSGWQSVSFNDSGWNGSSAAFGSGGSCPLQPTVSTSWQVNTDILTRRQINLPAGTSGVTVYIAIDNDATVYWNGTQIGNVTHEGCPSYDDFNFAVPAGALTTGSNILAVDGHDRGSESFLDIAVRGTVGPPPAEQGFGTDNGAWGPVIGMRRVEPVNTANGNYCLMPQRPIANDGPRP